MKSALDLFKEQLLEIQQERSILKSRSSVLRTRECRLNKLISDMKKHSNFYGDLNEKTL